MTYRWLCWSRQHFHSMVQSNFQFGYQSNFHIFFATAASWRVFHLLQEDSEATLCYHINTNIRRHLSLLCPTCASLEASASVLHGAIRQVAHTPCAWSLISRGQTSTSANGYLSNANFTHAGKIPVASKESRSLSCTVLNSTRVSWPNTKSRNALTEIYVSLLRMVTIPRTTIFRIFSLHCFIII